MISNVYSIQVWQVANLLYIIWLPATSYNLDGRYSLSSLLDRFFHGMQVTIWAPIYASKLFEANAQPGSD